MKEKTKFICTNCGYETPKWLGKCPSCSAWSTFEEQRDAVPAKYDSKSKSTSERSLPQKLSEISEADEQRITTGSKELNRVLGGGIVRGSMVLVGGDPGIGKSTLLLQICHSAKTAGSILYVTGEESAQQVKMRAARLEVNNENLQLLAETNLDEIIFHASNLKPDIMIIDSIQTMYRAEVASAPGSVAQVREATHFLMRLAKENAISVFIVGHVTKEGSIAGPRVLEHMVDCVLYFEGDHMQSYRILRTVKNRFGSTNEIGVFEMKDSGLEEVENPSALMLSGRPENATGSAIVCTMEGTRPMLAEIQALSSQTSFAIARRMSNGIDGGRATMLVAILEKRLGYSMQNQDVYINAAGGLKIAETASDLAVITAVASNYKDFPIDDSTVILGEVGLTGEVRSIGFAQSRIAEAHKLGFKRCILPKGNMKGLKSFKDIEIIPVSTVKETIQILKKLAKS